MKYSLASLGAALKAKELPILEKDMEATVDIILQDLAAQAQAQAAGDAVASCLSILVPLVEKVVDPLMDKAIAGYAAP